MTKLKKTKQLKQSFLLSVGLLLFASSHYLTTTIAQVKISPSIVLRADKIKVTLPCPPGMPNRSGSCNDDQVVGLIAEIKDSPEGSNWSYRYEVSGGRIVGSGAKVNLDLSGLKPGTYTITVYATASQEKKTDEVVISSDKVSIKVESCPDCGYGDPCPVVSVEASENPIKAGEKLIFKGNAYDPPPFDIRYSYNWTISAGTIVKGQGTKIIEVDTTGLEGQDLTAVLEVGGGMVDCRNRTVSSTVKIIK